MRVLAVALIAFLGVGSALAGEDVKHVVSQGNWSQSPTVPDKMAQRVKDTAIEYEQNAPIPRVAFYDIAYPSTDAELKEMASYGVLLLSVLSQDSNEIPPKRLYAVFRGRKILLHLIVATTSPSTQDPLVAKVLGPNRWDGLYLFPVYLTQDDVSLAMDFAASRTDFTLGHFATSDQTGLNYAHILTEAPSAKGPPSRVVAQLISREFPGFLKRDP
jgi:hypothetical protein